MRVPEGPKPVFADPLGRLHTASELQAVGRSGREIWALEEEDLIPLPPDPTSSTLSEEYPLE